MTGRLIVLGSVAIAVAAIGTTMDAGMTPRFVWNASASVPIGLYSVHPAHHLTVTALVVAYPPEPLPMARAGPLSPAQRAAAQAHSRPGRADGLSCRSPHYG
jgi:type IV secretory pathway protease TraF